MSYNQLSRQPILSPKEVASQVPNLVMPDYGSAMTGTIYARGLGSRLDQPVVQILVDGVPILDKNAFDTEELDLRRVRFTPGPHGTMYGRNSMGGILEMTTFQPMDVNDWGLRATLGYSTANTVEARASVYQHKHPRFASTIGASYGRTDGFYTNAFTGKKIDGNDHASGRIVLQWQPTDRWLVTATTRGSWIKQGAFPYADANTGVIAFNSTAGYERYLISQSVRAIYEEPDYHLELVGAYQFLEDDMKMDQDYTPASIFTLNQHQRQHNLYIDAILHGKHPVSWYSWSVGATAFYKHNTMSAAVVFMRDGIESVILANANNGIRTAFPSDSLEIHNEELPIYSDFAFTNIAGAVYHQSSLKPIERLTIDVGLRVDLEYSTMDFNSSAELYYRMTAFMRQPKHYRNSMWGTRSQIHVSVLPKVHIRYDWDRVSLYTSAARGSKAGGYNPQIFSTIMQTRLMNGLMKEMNVTLINRSNDKTDYSSADITAYAPETAWTTELGARYHENDFSVSAVLFYSDVQNQQVTVFPSGKTTGRMMSNAAHARSMGAEASLHYRYRSEHWQVEASAEYGFTDARFVTFDNGMGVYDGKLVPYIPQHTMSVQGTAEYKWNNDWSMALTVSTRGQGRTYWDEANEYSQPYYQLMDGSVNLTLKNLTLQLWARNLIGTEYDVFYFVSMSNPFLQRSKPRQLGARIVLTI